MVRGPLLDVSDVLLDPDFCDATLVCIRNNESVSQQGRSVITTLELPFVGVVTSERGDVLNRNAVSERIGGTIIVITQFSLREAGENNAADIVVWGGRQYTVVDANNYSTYGAGFMETVCERVPLAA